MSAPDAVLHVGMQQSGATMLQRALSGLRPQLRTRGVAYVGHGQISRLEHVAGWQCRAGFDRDQSAAFEDELAAAVARERAKVTGTEGPVLVSSDHLIGSRNLDQGDGELFRPHAVAAITQMTRALGAERVRLVLYTHRQDRLMELCYLRGVKAGHHHEFPQQFPYRFEPVLDYTDLIARLSAVPQVVDVRVRPFELVAGDPAAFIDDLLDTVGLRGTLDLDVIGGGLSPHRVYSRRGLKIALAMNPHLETRKDRKLVREFLLDNFAARDDRDSRFLPKRVRGRILETYREPNRELFRRHMPDLPEDSYDGNAATARLGTLSPRAPAVAHGTSGPPADDAGEPPADGASGLRERIARTADRRALPYRIKLRWLSRRCDVFLVSFPKCGRTWLRVMLGTALGDHFGVEVANIRRFTDADVDHPGLPRVLATHDDSPQGKPAHQVIDDKRGYRDRKVILLVRDPRDVVVSLYFHVTRRRRRPYDGDLSTFVRDPVGSLASLLAFYDAWAARARAEQVLLVRYEDMHADPRRELRRVLAFIGVADCSDATVDRAVAAASFERMQRSEREGTAGTRALRTATTGDPESYKVRRGKVGGFADYLSADDIRYIDDAIAGSRGARDLGYTKART